MGKKLTPMQMLIEELRRANTSSTLDTADIIEKNYLPKEREAIEEAQINAYRWHNDIPDKQAYELASDYFTQTYKQ